MNIISKSILFFTLLFIFNLNVHAQQEIIQDYSQLMKIPGISAMEASPAHLYMMSEKDGLVVFRAYPDSLQWLYTSSGMQQRGHTIRADIRFAYLYGDSRRMTVLEPTSVLGVYSSTVLPVKPKAAARIENSLYFALGDEGLGKVSLESPETVDTEVEMVAESEINGAAVQDIRSLNAGNQLFVLTDEPGLMIFDQRDNGLELRNQISLRRPVKHIFIDDSDVWGSTGDGKIYEIRSSGTGTEIGDIDEPVYNILKWENQLFVRGNSGKIWKSDDDGSLQLWKNDGSAGNYLAKSNQRFWISENGNISEIKSRAVSSTTSDEAGSTFRIKDIPDQVLPYPSPLMLPLEMEGNYPATEVEFSYRSNVDNANIRKQGFYWQPTVNQSGTYWFNIVATNTQGQTDSTRFTVDVRSFNSPPRFSPVRGTSIAVNETFSMRFQATDPENPQSSLLRYIGVDMPDGAQLDEKTGQFSWTPSERQVGESTFKIIATDRLGAASSVDVTLKVLDIARDSRK